MPLCPAGSSPKSTSPTTYWITANDIRSWVGADTYSRLAPWVWNLAEQVVAVSDLCSREPPQPPTITDTDVLLASSNPISAIGFANRLNDFAKWWAWSQLCQCNGSAACTTQTYDLVLGQNLQFNPNGPSFVWPTTTPGITTAPGETYLALPPSCLDVNITPSLMPLTVQQPQLRWLIQDCTSQLYNQSHIFGQPQHVTIRSGTCANGQPGVTFQWAWNVDPNNYPHWQMVISPVSGTVGPPTPAPPPTNITITIAPYPNPNCGTLNDVCAIVWNIKNYQTAIQNNTYTDSHFTDYTFGVQTQISGQGEHAVAAGTRGLLVTAESIPPQLQPKPTDPPEYFNVGWLRTGNSIGWDRKAWFRTSGQRVFPPWPTFTRFGWTLADQVVLEVTELL